MDPATSALAAAAVQFLIPYFKTMGDGVAKELGKKIADGPEKLYHLIKSKFSNHADAANVLEAAKSNPDDVTASQELEATLAQVIGQDKTFAEGLRTIVVNSGGLAAQNSFTTEVKGTGNKAANFGVVNGDVSF